jgi:ribosomal protein S18 acetylase RimI-like enzyme
MLRHLLLAAACGLVVEGLRFEVRRATRADVPAVAELLTATFEDPTLKWFDLPERQRRRARYAQALDLRVQMSVIGGQFVATAAAAEAQGAAIVVGFIEHGLLPPPSGWPPDALAADVDRKETAYDDGGVFQWAIADDDDDEGTEPGDVPFLANLCVAVAHQRQGLARRLVATAEHDLRGHCSVFVAVEASNTGARAMYLRLGFLPVAPPVGSPARRKVYYQKPL